MNNIGKGKAFDIEVTLDVDDSLLMLYDPKIYIGNLEPLESTHRIFEAKILVQKNKEKLEEIILGRVDWYNCDKTRCHEEFSGELLPQNTELNWEKLSKEKPYSLEAISKENDLIGRSEQIRQLENKIFSDELESSIIFGQKRVGKTSIAKIIENKLKKHSLYTAIYISVGSLDKSSPEKFLKSLGEYIYEEIIDDQPFNEYKLPGFEFEDSITPLDKLFRKIRKIEPNHKFVIILDEFDEIPSQLYKLTDIGDNFFHNIRSLSSNNNIGFILVGGENMTTINQSTDKLNKFESFPVDYFDKGRFWKDFQDLVCKPVEGIIEFTDNAILELYKMTEGNPFFTKLICGNIYNMACETRNAYVSYEEVTKAISKSLSSINSNNVNHFWKDGIKESDPVEVDKIETQRRKFLISYAREIRSGKNSFTKEVVLNNSILDKTVTTKVFESFVNRKILIEESENYRFKPLFFDKWLTNEGFNIITSEALDEQAIEELEKEEDRAYVEDTEIVDLCKSWGEIATYRAQQITPQHIRSWLDQFSNNIEKRLMFILLLNLKFYTQIEVREKLGIIHNEVKKGLVYKLPKNAKGETKTREVLLSAFGSPTKSGSTYLRLYATVNNFYRSSSHNVSLSKIKEAIIQDKEIQRIVFIEDIIGSGQSIIRGLDTLSNLCGSLIKEHKITVFVGAICGFESGIENIEIKGNELPFNVKVFVCDHLTEQDQCFSESSSMFNSSQERNKAKEIAYTYGSKLVKTMPLGYKDNQLLVSFFETCPNNSLPILWAEKSDWKAIFRRD